MGRYPCNKAGIERVRDHYIVARVLDEDRGRWIEKQFGLDEALKAAIWVLERLSEYSM